MRRTVLLPIFALVLVSACSHAGPTSTLSPSDPSLQGPIASTDTALGARVYATRCNDCHPGGARGYGPTVANVGFAPEHMRHQIRAGKGRMPGFPARDLDGPTLEALLAYLKTIGAVTEGATTPTPSMP